VAVVSTFVDIVHHISLLSARFLALRILTKLDAEIEKPLGDEAHCELTTTFSEEISNLADQPILITWVFDGFQKMSGVGHKDDAAVISTAIKVAQYGFGNRFAMASNPA